MNGVYFTIGFWRGGVLKFTIKKNKSGITGVIENREKVLIAG